MNELLIIFLKNPVLSKVKTRLATSIGDANALAVYLHLLHHTRTVTQDLAADKVIYYSDFIDTEDGWPNQIFRKAFQRGADLGEKMSNAFIDAFRDGYKKICIIGTDCEEISDQIINEAFKQLGDYDVVIGPAKDGGYYLLGMKEMYPSLFSNKRWSSDTVVTATLEDCRKLGLRVFQLPLLSDIDTVKDLSEILKRKLKL